jgi:hypothetical protein
VPAALVPTSMRNQWCSTIIKKEEKILMTSTYQIMMQVTIIWCQIFGRTHISGECKVSEQLKIWPLTVENFGFDGW